MILGKKIIVSLICFILIIFNPEKLFISACPIDDVSSNIQNSRQSDSLPQVPLLGGPYRRILSQTYDHKQFEVHHVITKAALGILRFFCNLVVGQNEFNSFLFNKKQNWAPSIMLTSEDHRRIPSSIGKTCLEYHKMQAIKLILTGDMESLIEDEISFIEQNLNKNNKYSLAIQHLREYVKSLNIHLEGSFLVLTINGEKKYIPIIPQNRENVLTQQ